MSRKVPTEASKADETQKIRVLFVSQTLSKITKQLEKYSTGYHENINLFSLLQQLLVQLELTVIECHMRMAM
jgi:hypothetical protein